MDEFSMALNARIDQAEQMPAGAERDRNLRELWSLKRATATDPRTFSNEFGLTSRHIRTLRWSHKF